jgi:uncharacterized protein (DUF1800 family)
MASLQPMTGKLGEHLAAHLLRRTTFNFTKARIKEFADLTAQEAVQKLMEVQPPKYEQPIDVQTGAPWINNGTPTTTENFILRKYVVDWQLSEFRYDTSIHSMLTWFLHSIWITNYTTPTDEDYFDYLALLRFYSTGSFKQLALKMSLNNIMLRYLNNTDNTKDAPNENYAREFLELFTIGKGLEIAPGDYTNYKEEDVIAGAKLLTGFRTSARGSNIDPDTNLSRGNNAFARHNTDPKQFSTAFNSTVISPATSAADMDRELKDYVDMIFAQKETARFYCRRLYRFLVSTNVTPEVESDIIVPLADALQNADYETSGVITTLLTSLHFYDLDDSKADDEIIGGLLKSPLDIYLQTTNLFQIEWQDMNTDVQNFYKHIDKLVISVMLNNCGLLFLAPSDVAGYGPYYQSPEYDKGWFTANTIIARYKIPQVLLSGQDYLSSRKYGVQLNAAEYVKNSGDFSSPSNALFLVSDMLKNVFAIAPDADRNAYFLSEFLDDLPLADWTYEWNNYIQSGDDTEVNLGLARLIDAVFSSQEYQLK